LRGEESIAVLCRREGIVESLYYNWSKEFLEAGKRRLSGDTARLEIEIMDRFGRPVVPREWFLVPLFVISEAVELHRSGACLAPSELQPAVTSRQSLGV